jgi:succinate-semialdehyde dehydrogenase/glutarate-semialdehyde dehydrogenase
VIFKDADLEKSAQICAMAKMVNNGQACISAKRFLIESSIKAEFLDLFFTELQKLKLGLAQNPSTDRGALAHQRFVVQLKKQVSEHLSTGGKLVFSEKLPPEFSETSYHPIQIVETNVDHPHFKNQEYFGPVGMVAEFTDSDQVVKAINDSEYGLGAALFAKNLNLANEIATGLQVGMVAVNAMIKSDIRVPFGGVRGSGYGKELGKPGFYEFINHQFVGFD